MGMLPDGQISNRWRQATGWHFELQRQPNRGQKIAKRRAGF
jgi:hypothetical protein